MVKVKIYKSTIGSGFEEHVYFTGQNSNTQDLLSLKLSSEKAPIINGMWNEAVRATVEFIGDSFLLGLVDSELTTIDDVSYYDMLVYDDDTQIFRGVIPLDSITRKYGSDEITIIAYTYDYLMTKIDKITSPTPLFSLGRYLTSFKQSLSSSFYRGSLISFAELISANNRSVNNVRLYKNPFSSSFYSNATVDQGMASTHHTITDDEMNIIDEWWDYEYRLISYRPIPRFINEKIQYIIQRRMIILKIYNNVCVEEVVNTEENLSTVYNTIGNAYSAVEGLRGDFPEYYDDRNWIGSSYTRYTISEYNLYFSGFLLPTNPVFKDGTSFTKMLKAYFLMHNLSFKFHGGDNMANGFMENPILEVVKNNSLSYTNIDVTSRLVDLEKSRLSPMEINFSSLDSLLGDASILKSYLSVWFSDVWSATKQYKLTVDDISHDDIHIFDVILANGINMKVMQLEKNIINDEYKLITWGVEND